MRNIHSEGNGWRSPGTLGPWTLKLALGRQDVGTPLLVTCPVLDPSGRARGGSLGLWGHLGLLGEEASELGEGLAGQARRGPAPHVTGTLGPQGATSQDFNTRTHLRGLPLMRVSNSK